MNGWDAEQIAAASGARLMRAREGGPLRAAIDSRAVGPGDLFVGLRGEHVDGGAYAEQALRAGAWGVLVAPEYARALAAKGAQVWLESQKKRTHTTESRRATPGREPPLPGVAFSHSEPPPPGAVLAHSEPPPPGAVLAHSEPPRPGAVLAHPDPLAGLQALAAAWREALGQEGAKVVGITGSTGKTSTKDILAAILRDAQQQLGGLTVASRANLNTEIGLPLTVLSAPPSTKALVLEMAMRGAGQIAQLTAIAKPDVGVIVNVGPVHLQQLGTLAAVAAAKGELVAGMASGTTVVVPAGEPLLEPHLRGDLRTVTFGEGGDVELVGRTRDGEVTIVDHTRGGERVVVRPSFAQSHNLRNLLAATAAARALGVTPQGNLDVELSALRGERIVLANGIVLINDCYNANPMSMRAALDDLAAGEGAREGARKVAVLGDMLELGGEERRMHREIGDYARACGVELLLTVGPLAREMGEKNREEGEGAVYAAPDAATAAALLPDLLRAGDVVLVKGSRGVGLELVAQTLQGGERVAQTDANGAERQPSKRPGAVGGDASSSPAPPTSGGAPTSPAPPTSGGET